MQVKRIFDRVGAETKRGRPERRPKSREETPKEGCTIEHVVRWCIAQFGCAMHKISEGRSSQACALVSPANTPQKRKRPGAGPGL